MKRNRSLSVISALLLAVSVFALFSPTAKALTYKGSNTYKSGPYYEKLCAVELTGDPRTDIVNIAKSQVGYFEGDNAYQLAGTVNGTGNFTEYGRWYGLQDMWCAMFVSWCAYVANVPESVVIKHAYTPTGLSFFQNKGRAYSRADVAAGAYTPQPGDIIYFKSPRNSNPTNHVGIVTKYSNKTVYTVEGNTSSLTISTNGGTVAEKSYDISDTYIVYICCPDYEQSGSSAEISAVLDEYSAVRGGVKIRGWCFDKNDAETPLEVHVYIGGPATDENADVNTETVANAYRPDVNNVYGCGNNHGFDSTVATSKTGKQTVYVYAVNPKTSDKILISTFSADIPSPEDPKKKKADINKDGYVNNKDIVELFRYVSSGNTAEDESVYDYNEDGDVNNKDVTALFRYISSYSN